MDPRAKLVTVVLTDLKELVEQLEHLVWLDHRDIREHVVPQDLRYVCYYVGHMTLRVLYLGRQRSCWPTWSWSKFWLYI